MAHHLYQKTGVFIKTAKLQLNSKNCSREANLNLAINNVFANAHLTVRIQVNWC